MKNADEYHFHADTDDHDGTETDADRTEDEASDERSRAVRLANIKESGSITTKHGGFTFHTLLIAGQVEGHSAFDDRTKATKYEHVIPELIGVEEDESIDGLLLLLNTVGGDVEAGLAIAELIAGMKTPSVSLVLGGGHSIGVPLAVCADRSFIVPSATMTVHPVRMTGLVIGTPQTFTYFSRMQSRINDFILAHSHITQKHLKKLMFAPDTLSTDIGSVIDGHEAVECGLIDGIGSLSDALETLRTMAASAH